MLASTIPHCAPSYYAVNVKYDNEVFPTYLNVGRAKNTGLYHLYDITNKIRDTANRINGFEGLREFPSINDISSDNIHDSTAKSQEKLSDREISDISNADYARMYHHFGSTKNYDVAGYLLGNGVMLDFSGRHWGDKYSTSRQVDHRDTQEVIGNRDSSRRSSRYLCHSVFGRTLRNPRRAD